MGLTMTDSPYDNDYLSETLKTEKHTQIEIFEEMIYRLEKEGKCRKVYHRLAFVLFGEDWTEE